MIIYMCDCVNVYMCDVYVFVCAHALDAGLSLGSILRGSL